MDIALDLDMLWKMLLAVLLGGIIGIEREWFNKSAGLRSMILICLGATIFTMCSQKLGNLGDHSRIASNIVVGIGFVGGGVIFKGDNGIKGITTAVSIWVTASIGMLVGSMHWEVACIATAVVVMVLLVLTKIELVIDRVNSVRTYKLAYPYELYKEHYISNLVKACGLKMHSNHHKKEGTLIRGVWQIQGAEKAHRHFIKEVLDNVQIQEFEF